MMKLRCTNNRYYATIFLNQIKLYKNVPEVPSKLVQVYFRSFATLVGYKDGKFTNVNQKSMSGKMLSGLLTGVNRAFPFLSEMDEEYVSFSC